MIASRFFQLLFLVCFFFISCEAQDDLTDSDKNGDYKIIEEINLPKDLKESSGILYIDSLVISFNDSGNKPILFGLDTETGEIKYEWKISNVKNTDWEDIAQDKKYIYIGDFGNNLGNRKDLAIYKVNKMALFSTNGMIEAEIINFSFEDQTNFTMSFYQHSFDCEAMICSGDSIYIFSKDWKNIVTTSYSLPKVSGTYIAKKGETFDTKGLVTGADYMKNSNILIFTGYLNYQPFLWIFKDFEGTDFFSGSSKRIDLTSISNIQNEGISFFKTDTILMSTEKTNMPASLFKIEINNL